MLLDRSRLGSILQRNRQRMTGLSSSSRSRTTGLANEQRDRLVECRSRLFLIARCNSATKLLPKKTFYCSRLLVSLNTIFISGMPDYKVRGTSSAFCDLFSHVASKFLYEYTYCRSLISARRSGFAWAQTSSRFYIFASTESLEGLEDGNTLSARVLSISAAVLPLAPLSWSFAPAASSISTTSAWPASTAL